MAVSTWVPVGPLSWTASQRLAKSFNAWLLYRLGYDRRAPRALEGTRIHEVLADAAAGRREDPLVSHVLDLVGEPVGIEVAVEDRDRVMKGIVDLVTVDSSGLRVIDWKTGRDVPVHLDQVHWYGYCFESWGIPPAHVDLFYVKHSGQLAGHKEKRYDPQLARALYRKACRQIEFLRQAERPEYLVVPVHGTKADELQRRIVEEIDLVDLELEIVEEVAKDGDEPIIRDGKPLVGKRLYLGDTPVGWIPDTIKNAILARRCWVFVQFEKTNTRSAGLRVKIPTTEIAWPWQTK